MRSSSAVRAITVAAALVTAAGCGKKDKSDPDTTDSGGSTGTVVAPKTGDNAPASIAAPAGVLSLAFDSMASVMAVAGPDMMASGGAALTEGENGFTEADCTEHADPNARSTDPAQDKDDMNRLRLSHPRAALQSFYCQMQKDTGSADSFLGALSQQRLLFCLMGEGLVFNGVATERVITEAIIDGCDISAEDKAQMFPSPWQDLTMTLTSSRPAAFGDPESWDGSILMTVSIGDQSIELKTLLKDSDGVLAIATLGGGKPYDGYVAAINKTSGEIHWEAKFQRLGLGSEISSSSEGWNRHSRAYVKGTFDDNLLVSDVETLYGAYSDISREAGGSVSDGLQMGSMWTMGGTMAGGFKTYAYELGCTNSPSRTCSDANLSSNWVATEGSGACNGSLTGETCSSDGLPLSTDADTAFVMEPGHADFESATDWFEALKIPSYTTMDLKITQ